MGSRRRAAGNTSGIVAGLDDEPRRAAGNTSGVVAGLDAERRRLQAPDQEVQWEIQAPFDEQSLEGGAQRDLAGGDRGRFAEILRL
jgi:hypothetical protein